MTDRRVVFDFDIEFANGGGVQGQDFRLDLDSPTITDEALADHIVRDLNLLMVERVEILNKRYIEEAHKRTTHHGGAVRFLDLSHPIRDGMITYPGLPGPVLRTHMSREESRAHYADGVEFDIGAIEMVANTGTYLDAPFHRYSDGDDLSALPLDRLVGAPGVVVHTDDRSIGSDAFADIETRGMAILIRTGWDSHFGQDDYLGSHPHLTEEGVRRLVAGGVALVGIDSANIDDTRAGLRPAHSLLLKGGIPIVEHLTRLDQVPDAAFEFYAIPAPVVGLGTFPVRAVARWSEN